MSEVRQVRRVHKVLGVLGVLVTVACQSAPVPEQPTPDAAAARPADTKKEDWSLYGSTPNAQEEIVVDKDSLGAAHTDWPLVVAQVKALRRSGTTLEVKVALHNGGVEMQKPMFIFSDAHIVDPNTGVKYGVMMDGDKYLANANPIAPDRFYQDVDPGETIDAEMTFAAPPANVKVVDLEIPNIRPLERLLIQDR